MTGRSSKENAIAGLGLVLDPKPGFTARALEAEAARLAIEDAGLKLQDVDGAIEGKLAAGPAISAESIDAFPRVLGIPFNFFFSVGRGGTAAALSIALGAKMLELGCARYVAIAIGMTRRTRSRRLREKGEVGAAGHIPKEGQYTLTFGATRAASVHSLLASRHMHEFGTTCEQLGAVAVSIRQWACKNPLARMYKRPLTVEEYLASPFMVWPYRKYDFCLVSDAAIAIVLTTADRAKALRRRPIYVAGIGFGEAAAQDWWQKTSYTRLPVRTAKEAAFRQAQIELRDVNLAQLYDCFTAEVLLQLEDYGWCKKGEGGPFVQAGHIAYGGDVPVNTGGGMLSAYYMIDFTGLSEAIMQLRGDAGERQVKDAEICLVSGHGGEILEPMCSIHSTLVLRR
ncbi:MAG: thiolase family protein [Chloroflexi bacterium]|nr:thiolase family protein [Chloroflexota bacterium]